MSRNGKTISRKCHLEFLESRVLLSSPALSLTDTGTGIDEKVTIESQNQFRLVFEAADNWGLSQWYDLVNDPGATTNLGFVPSVNPNDPPSVESGLFQMVWYGTTPDDPKLYIQAAKYNWPNTARSFTISENTANRIVVTALSHPMLNAGVLDNLSVAVTYYIYPDGKMYINSQMTATNAQTAGEWRCAVIGLSDPSQVGSSTTPDSQGWIRASTTQNPYSWTGNTENYIFEYWSHSTGGGLANWTKASIMLVPDPANTHMTFQSGHNWTGVKRWFYGSGNSLSMSAGQTITQNYMIQLGSENSTVLPNLINSTACDPIANTYRSNPTPPPVGSTPNAPSGLTATATSQTQINFSWTDNSSNETGFYIDRATNSGFTANLVTTSVGANVVSSSATGLSAGTTYYFRVRAYNANGSSANTSTASATTQAGAPAAPSNLTASASSQTQINLTWTDNSSNETGFYLDRATDSGFTANLVTNTLGANVTSSSATGLSANTTYYFRVRAYNGSGSSANTSTASATTLPNAPTAPSSLTATAASSSQINLSWTDNSSNETGFYIDRATNSGFTTNLVTTSVGANVTSSSATGLAGSTTYYFRVRAYNAGGSSANSATASATTQAASGGLPAYDGFNYTSGTALNGASGGSGWSGNWVVAGDSPSSTVISSTGLTAPSPADTLQTSGLGVNMGAVGSVATRTINTPFGADGTTIWASTLITVDVDGTDPYHYSGMQVGDFFFGYTFQNAGIYYWRAYTTDTSWWGPFSANAPVHGATYFMVAQLTFASGTETANIWLNPAPGSTAPSAGSALFNLSGFTCTPTSTMPISIGSPRYYNANSFDEVRVGSTYADVAPANASAPAAPSALSATAASQTQINTAWTDNSSNETGFYIDRATNSGFTTGLVTTSVGANVTTYSATGLSAGTTYYFRVRAYNAGGSSANTSTASATTQAASDPIESITSATAGNWSSASTWTGGIIPGSAGHTGAVVTLNHNVTMDMDVTLGTNTAVATCLTIANGKTLTVNTGKTLKVRGNVLQQGQGSTGAIVTFNAGSALVFDSTRLTATSTVLWWQISDGYYNGGATLATLNLNGTSLSHVSVSAVSGGGAGRFKSSAYDAGDQIIATYTDFSRIGDATYMAFNPIRQNRTDLNATLSLTYCTFNTCGVVSVCINGSDNTYGLLYEGSFIVQHCTFINSQGTYTVHIGGGNTAPNSGQIWDVSYNTFDKAPLFDNYTQGITHVGNNM